MAATPSARAWEVLRGALALPPAQRAAFVSAACDDDAALHAEVTDLLHEDSRADSLLDARLDPERILGSTDAALIGSEIGGYRLLAELGRGGMGAVYRAERIGGVARHHVALKLIKRGMDSEEIVRRFVREREILAQLKHPNIARLIDGGISERGQVWFAMELVEGAPITQWCDAQRLDVRQRIERFLFVCAAVQYAHRNLIVHRDLKPNNILVSNEREVKLLDFGIAKLLDERLHTDAQTRSHLRLLTPEFAAPEQRRGDAITTATDVYQLGLVLYELLSGRRAIRRAAATTAPQVPLRLALATSAPSDPDECDVDTAAAARRTNAAGLRRALSGDLERIAHKALSDEPSRRYESVGDLADDLRRFMDGRPVLARPDSMWYRASKFVSRHAIGSLLVFLAVGMLIAASIYSAHEARNAREQLARADAVREFLVGVFENADPDENKGQPISAGQLLEKGEQQLNAGAIHLPAVQADLTGLIGSLYVDLGDFAHTQPIMRRALDAANDPHIPGDIRARNLRQIAAMEIELRTFDAAIAHARQAIALASADPRSAEESNTATRVLASALIGKGKAADAQPLLREVISHDRIAHGESSQPVAEDWILLGSSLDEIKQFDETVAAFRAGIDITRSLRGDLNTTVANGYNFLGIVLGHHGDFAGAEKALRESLRIREAVQGSAHRETLVVRSNLLRLIERQGRIEEALEGRMQMLEAAKLAASARPEELAYAHYFLGGDYNALGRFEEAERAYRQSLAIWAGIQGSNNEIDSADPLVSLASNLQLQGHYREAEALFRQVMEIAASHQSRNSVHWLGWSRSCLGNLQRLQHHYEEARSLIAEGIAGMNQPGNESDPALFVMRAELAEAELDAGHIADAEAAATQSLAAARKQGNAANLRLGSPLFALARVKLAQSHPDEAEHLLREALAVRSPPHPLGDPRVLELQVALIDALSASGKESEAAQLRATVDPLLAKLASPYAADLRGRLAGTGAKHSGL